MSYTLETYVKEIQGAFADNLKSIVLFGSKASGEDSKENSDHNLLVIVEKIVFQQMAFLVPATKKWSKAGNPPPLVFTAEEFAHSADVFPIEYLDMKDGHRLIYGKDFLEEIKVNGIDLRHECEFELRSKLLKLRQSYLILKGKPKEIRTLLIDSISSFLVLFRYAVKLSGGVQPAKKIDSIGILAQKAGIREDVFMSIHSMKHGNKDALKLDPEELIEDYMHEIDKVITLVDKL